MFRRIMGIIMLVVGLVGIVLSIAGTIYGRNLVDSIGASLNNSLALTSQSLDTVINTLVLVKQTVQEVNSGLDTVETTATDVAMTISQTRPLLDQITGVVSEDAPNSIEAVQAAIPQLEEVATAIDSTLTTLNNFRIDETILGVPIRYSLGIDYDPEVPFNESVQQIGDSLEGLPARLRTLRVYINVTSNNLETIGQGVRDISRDLNSINDRIAETNPLLDEYIRIATETNDSARQRRASLAADIATAKRIITVLMVWLGLTQLAPIYLGYELLKGQPLANQVEVVRVSKVTE